MRLGLMIDLDMCVGCHACAVACKEWNTGATTGPLSDYQPYGAKPSGVWFNRIRHYEVGEYPNNKTINFPMSCLHCKDAECVTVCPTGASWKRPEDGIVLVDQEKCMGCNLCAWACPYGAREYDYLDGVMKKCTLCIDRIYNEHLAEEDRVPACVRACPTGARAFGDLGDPESAVSKNVAARGGYDLMPEMGYKPTNKYLPPRDKRAGGPAVDVSRPLSMRSSSVETLFAWVDKALSGKNGRD